MANKTDIKHSMFIKEYLKTLNGTRAYMKVYPDASYENARVNASILLTKDNIQKEVKERLKSIHMSVEETLKLLADHARGNLDDFLDADGNVDIQKARNAGLTHLLKEFEVIETDNEKGSTSRKKIKLHDPQKALELIGKYYALFTDKTDITERKIIRVTISKDDADNV